MSNRSSRKHRQSHYPSWVRWVSSIALAVCTVMMGGCLAIVFMASPGCGGPKTSTGTAPLVSAEVPLRVAALDTSSNPRSDTRTNITAGAGSQVVVAAPDSGLWGLGKGTLWRDLGVPSSFSLLTLGLLVSRSRNTTALKYLMDRIERDGYATKKTVAANARGRLAKTIAKRAAKYPHRH